VRTAGCMGGRAVSGGADNWNCDTKALKNRARLSKPKHQHAKKVQGWGGGNHEGTLKRDKRKGIKHGQASGKIYGALEHRPDT